MSLLGGVRSKSVMGEAQIAEEKPPAPSTVKPLAGETVKVFLSFDMDVNVYRAVKGSAFKEAISVEQMTHKILAHAIGFEVPE